MVLIRFVSLLLIIFGAYFGSWLWSGQAIAGVLADRVAQFPHWQEKPMLEAAKADLLYPGWMAGTWQVTSTLEDLIAPLAPQVETPGFAKNQKYLHRPVSFQVKFRAKSGVWGLPMGNLTSAQVVADRAFNGLQISRAYLGDRALSVKVKSRNPNDQVTQIRTPEGRQQQLVSLIIQRGSETPQPDRFIASEVAQQIFRGKIPPYINQVETTTVYEHQGKQIIGDQITAVYLAPQDRNYWQALDRPVALYRYKLRLKPVNSEQLSSLQTISNKSGHYFHGVYFGFYFFCG